MRAGGARRAAGQALRLRGARGLVPAGGRSRRRPVRCAPADRRRARNRGGERSASRADETRHRRARRRAPPKDVSSAQFVPNHELRPEQKDAVQRILGSGARFEAFLLHGVTGSGKTEVYLHLIAGAIERGAQSLVLVPEISLTPQLEERFRHAFPQARLAGLHGGLEDTARPGAWPRAARGEAAIVLGTRLALLAPPGALGPGA